MFRRFSRPLGVTATAILTLVIAARVQVAGAAEPNASTPKGAAEAFFKALEAGDTAKAKSLATGDEKQMKLLDLLAPLVGNFKKMEQAAIKKWGDEGKKLLQNEGAPGPSAFDIEGQLKDAKVEEKGDTATITPTKKDKDADQPNEPTKLKKVGGSWKVDMGAIPNSEGMDDPNAQKVLKGMGDVAAQMASEIEQGKFKNVAEAKGAFEQKVMPLIFGALGNQPPGGGQPGNPGGEKK
jgi:hypothetical protein